MVPTLYFSVVMGGNSAIFGHKFFIMAQGAYVITQPGSLLHLSHGKSSSEILVKFHVFFEISMKFREISASFFESEISNH